MYLVVSGVLFSAALQTSPSRVLMGCGATQMYDSIDSLVRAPSARIQTNRAVTTEPVSTITTIAHLSSWAKAGLVECSSETATKSCWMLTRPGLVLLEPCVRLRLQRQVLVRRPDVLTKNMSLYELYEFLDAEDWDFEILKKGSSRKRLPSYEPGGKKIVFLRAGLAVLPKFYMLAVADAVKVGEPILHAQPENYYKKLLKIPGSAPSHDMKSLPHRGSCFELDGRTGTAARRSSVMKAITWSAPEQEDGRLRLEDVGQPDQDEPDYDDATMALEDVHDDDDKNGDLATSGSSDDDDENGDVATTGSSEDANPTGDSSSSSSDNSSDNDGSDLGGGDGSGAASVVAPRPAKRARRPDDGPRARRPQTHDWGEFRFTWKPNGAFGAWQATCPYHQDVAKTKCTRTRTVRATDSPEATLMRLKIWCLSWPALENKSAHQGLPDVELTGREDQDELDEQRELMMDPTLNGQ